MSRRGWNSRLCTVADLYFVRPQLVGVHTSVVQFSFHPDSSSLLLMAVAAIKSHPKIISTRICQGGSLGGSAQLAARVGVQKQAPLVTLALDLRCIYTHEQPLKFEKKQTKKRILQIEECVFLLFFFYIPK